MTSNAETRKAFENLTRVLGILAIGSPEDEWVLDHGPMGVVVRDKKGGTPFGSEWRSTHDFVRQVEGALMMLELYAERVRDGKLLPVAMPPEMTWQRGDLNVIRTSHYANGNSRSEIMLQGVSYGSAMAEMRLAAVRAVDHAFVARECKVTIEFDPETHALHVKTGESEHTFQIEEKA